jgi:GNAT superfamily N-acetyltransferase
MAFRTTAGLERPTVAATAAPISVRLDDEVRHILEGEARSRGLGLSALLRQIAKEAAEQVRRQRIREQSRAVGAYVAQSAEAAEFYEDWGTPRTAER